MNSELSMDRVLIENLTNILEVNLDKEHFGVKELAKEAGLSRSQLHRKLKSIKRKSSSKFICEFRLEKAMVMLQNNVATASEIAYRVGFSSPTYFNTCFHDHYGYPPGEVKFRNPIIDEDNVEIKNAESTEAFLISDEIEPSKKGRLRKRMVFINTFVIVLLSIVIYNLYQKYQNSIPSDVTNTGNNEKSIAMLHFKNLSGDIENQYFVDGMMDDVLNHLAGIQGLVVKSRQSSERYRESDKSTFEIGKELGVDYLLEGSVQNHGDSLRIIIQLIDTKKDNHIWADNYDFELKQVFTIQSNISKQIAEELNMFLSPDELEHIEKKPAENLEAYNLYLKGRFFWHRRNEENLNKSIYYFEKALELDSTYALAYAGLADSYFIIEFQDYNVLVIASDIQQLEHIEYTPAQNEAFRNVKRLALKSLSIDNTNSEPHATIGGIATWYEWNWMDAEKEFKQAITLNPNYATAHQWYAELLDILGRNKEAREQIDLALKLNPNSFIMYCASAMLYSKEGRYDKALIDASRAKEIDKNQGWPYWIIFEIYSKLGRDDEAIAEMEESWNFQSNIEMAKGSRVAYDKSGIKGVYKYIIDFDLENGFAQDQAYKMAQKYAFIEENEKALEWLEIAMKHHDLEMPKIKNDDYFKGLHNEPRFKAILKKMGFEN